MTVCSSSQIGKTIFQAITLGYEIDQDPGPSLFVMPNTDLARSFSETRLRPMFLGCPSIRRHIPMERGRRAASRSEWKKLEMHFDRMTLNIIGANSPASLASRPIRRLRLDEMDKFKGATEKEGDAPSLARERTKTFFNRKILETSTPTLTTGPIWQSFLRGDQRYFMVPCPHCKKEQRLLWPQIKWSQDSKTEDGYDVEKVRRDTWYECVHCQDRIDDRHKPWMLKNGVWQPTAKADKRKSWHISSQYSVLGNLKFGDISSQFVQCKKDIGALRVFVNSWIGEPWEERGEVADENAILAHRGDYDERIAPEAPNAVVLTADVQKSEIYYVVRAWGAHEISWLLEYGIVQDFSQLQSMLSRKYEYLKDGELIPCGITLALIDSGYDTDRVYRFCEETGFIPVRGRDGAQLVYPVKLFNGVLTLNTDYFKDALQQKIRMAVDSPGGWQLHRATRMDYAQHLSSEAIIEEADKWGRVKRKWKLVQGKDNHWLDCEVYQLALAYHEGWRQPTDTTVRTVKPMRRKDGRSWHER